MTSPRIAETFARCRSENRAAFVAYLMASDPDHESSLACMKALAESGADIIELGFPFTDPMADGPSIQKAALRALEAGGSLKLSLETAKRFRLVNVSTPVILMGYANPVHHMGYRDFAAAAADSGVDGAIIVDLPPEEDAGLRNALHARELAMIRLATPTTTRERMKTILKDASGFIYYVSVAGVTGVRAGAEADIATALASVRAGTDLPVVVGFGVRSPEQAKTFARMADGVVVGSALVDEIAAAREAGQPETAAARVSVLAASLSMSIRSVRA